jgi:hypothetical protein
MPTVVQVNIMILRDNIGLSWGSLSFSCTIVIPQSQHLPTGNNQTHTEEQPKCTLSFFAIEN